MEISLVAEKIFSLGGFAITNSMLTAFLITCTLLVVGFGLRRRLVAVPSRIQAALEFIYEFFYTSAQSMIGRDDVVNEVFPYIMTLFFFILFSNWSGLLPGVGTILVHLIHDGNLTQVPLLRAPTSDLNGTVALSALTIFYIQYISIKYSGLKTYVTKFFNFSNPIGFFVGIVEFISEFMRIISFSFRLFGNIFAGEVLISVILYLTITLVPYVAFLPLPFFILETFVGVIQAFIFCFLTLVFTSLSVTSHDAAGHVHGGEEMQLASKVEEVGQGLENSMLPTNN